MNWIEKIKRIPESNLVRKAIILSKKIVLPGFEGVPLYDVTVFFIRGLTRGYITNRASAISFSFFLAIFPFLIFLFTIIPFIPIRNFQDSLLTLLSEVMPTMAWESVKETIIDIITKPRSSLLILNFILALYFTSSGVNSLIEAFNNTYHDIETRSMVKQYLISLYLVLIISVLLIASIGLITFGSKLLYWILPATFEQSIFFFFLLNILRWATVLGLLLLAISFIYYYAPARSARFRFISAGSMLATLLIIITTLGFNYYVDNFSTYNVLYGSIGTVLIVLLWIYFNSFSLLIGFELNVSIVHVGTQKRP